MEIERKFLVRQLPDAIDQYPHAEIEQGYLLSTPTVRVRRYGAQCILTVKEHLSASGAIVNREEEFLMPEASYRQLLAKCDGRVVSKTRYRIPLGEGLVAELDVFHGRHQGLVLVEVEFASLDQAQSFVPPSWFADDVSADPRYRNSTLASTINHKP